MAVNVSGGRFITIVAVQEWKKVKLEVRLIVLTLVGVCTLSN